MAGIVLVKQFVLACVVVAYVLGPPVEGVTYFVRPYNGSCNASGIKLSPCFPLHQYNTTTMLSDREDVEVLFLPGYHSIPRPYFFEVSMKPWKNSTQMVEIDCRNQSGFIFNNITYKISIYYIQFTSCGPQSALVYDGIREDENTLLSMEIVDCVFKYNLGSAIRVYHLQGVLIKGCTFDSNFGERGGAIYSESTYYDVKLADLTIIDSVFSNNIAEVYGGAIYLLETPVTIERSSFLSNVAGGGGGAIYHVNSCLNCSDSVFSRNLALILSGGAIYYDSGTCVSFLINNSTLVHNEARDGGGAIHCGTLVVHDHLIVFQGTGVMNNNSATYGGFAYASNCPLQFHGNFTFMNNRALLEGGVVYSQSSTIRFHTGFFNVFNNTAKNSGGGLFLSDSSELMIIAFLRDNTTIVFENNSVTSSAGRGGAIYFDDGSYHCETLLQICPISYLSIYAKVNIIFRENHASEGSVIYGGLLDRCEFSVQSFDQIAEYEHTPLAITSDTMKLCLCSNHKPQCGLRAINKTKMRGNTIPITLAAVDQTETERASVIRASYNEIRAELDKGEGNREINGSCSELYYHIFTAETSATLTLRSDGPCSNSQLSLIEVHINVVPCAQGFEQSEDRCVCDRRLANYTDCHIDTLSVQRKGAIWLRYDELYLKINQHCPLDFCGVENNYISIASPDQQCANHRSGVLCGSCQQNFSIGLGGSKCLRCDGISQYNFIWLLVLFAVAGASLVALLLTCKLTTSVGDINGLIFYANVISISGLTNFPIPQILSVFVSWINLDFGIGACFYTGMDTYQKTWLQFSFPLYIWLLIVAITIASYYSSRAMKIFGRNNIAILATLFLLSYTKILKTITTALAFSEVLRGKADDVTDPLVPYRVWTYDGSVEYLKEKHVTLFVVALLFLVLLFLPYTLLLTFGQFVRSMRVRRGLRWVKSTAFVSIMDAYHAPYRRRHRYWTGFVLLTRCVLFITFATNSKESPLLSNMYAIAFVIVAILMLKASISDVYINPAIEKLEMSFFWNLAILAATVSYLEGRGEDISNTCKCVTASLSIAFITFVAILAHHAYLQIKTTKWYRSVHGIFLRKWQARKKNSTQEATVVSIHESAHVNKLPTSTSVELREPLLESGENRREK